MSSYTEYKTYIYFLQLLPVVQNLGEYLWMQLSNKYRHKSSLESGLQLSVSTLKKIYSFTQEASILERTYSQEIIMKWNMWIKSVKSATTK